MIQHGSFAPSSMKTAPAQRSGAIGGITIVDYLPLLAVALLVLWPKFVSFGGANLLTLVQIGVIALLPVWAVRERSKGLTQTFSLWPVLLWGAFALSILFDVISILAGGPQSSSADFLRLVITTKSLFITGFAIGTKPRLFRAFVIVLMSCLSISFVLAMIEQIIQVRMLSIVPNYLPVTDNDVVAALTASDVRDGNFRSGALFDHPIVLAILGGVGVQLGFACRIPGAKLNNAFALLFIMASALAGYLSFSRTYVVALIVGSVAFWMIRFLAGRGEGRIARGALLGAAVIVGGVILTPFVEALVQGRSQAEANSSYYRDLMWAQGWPYIQQRPLIGWGAGSDNYYAAIANAAGVTVDDSYLSLLVNSGMIGLVMVILVAFFGFSRALQISGSSDQRLALLSSAFGAAIIAIMVCQKATSIPAPFAYMYLFAGVLSARYPWAE